MKTTSLTPDEDITRKAKSLSRFHPRLKKAMEQVSEEATSQQKVIEDVPAPKKVKAASPVLEDSVPVAPVAVFPRKATQKAVPEFLEQKAFASRASASKSIPPEAPTIDEPAAGEPLEEARNIPITWMHRTIFAAALLLGFLFTFWYGRSLGHDEAMRLAKPVDVAVRPKLPAEAVAPFEAALAQLRDGKHLEALSALRALISDHPYAPSLHYAAALAAMQAGYDVEAGMMADASIRLGFRISDSLALKAAISALKSGRPSDDQEALLLEAVATDPMNPNPMLELATLHRYRGKNSEARALLESAGLRMTPTDSRTVLETTLAIMSADSELAAVATPTGIPTQDFPAALAQLHKGNFDQAAAILRASQQKLSPDLFYYLINDPELRKFSRQPELAGLF